jgi:type IV pilus biogenesis protein CpaD/CtpE
MAKRILALAVFIALARCASAPVNTDRLSSTEAPIRAAEELGATRVPEAALELRLAQDQMEQAKQFLRNGDKQHADMLLLRAQADAELAVALAKEAPLEAEAMNAAEQVKALQRSSQ